MGKSNRIGFKQLSLMVIMIVFIVFGATQYVKAENEVSFKYSYSSGKDSAIYDIRNDILPQMFPDLPSFARSTLQITLLVHFTDGDYYFDNATGKFSSAGSSTGNASSSSSNSSKTLSAPKSFKATLEKYNQVALSWKKVSGAKSYNVYRKVGSAKYKKIKNLKKTTYTDKKLKTGSKISYYVIAVNSSKKEGKKSGTKTVTTIGKVSGVTVQKKSSSAAIVAWKKAAGASGYQLSASEKKGKKKSKGNVKKTVLKKTLKVNTKKVKYYRVRAFQNVGNKKVYGQWSDEKTFITTSKNETTDQSVSSSNEVKEEPYVKMSVSSPKIRVSFKNFPDYDALKRRTEAQNNGYRFQKRATVNVRTNYTDAFFSESAINENYNLASLSAVAAASTYSTSDETKSLLNQCGFDNIVADKTGKSATEVGHNDNASYWLGNKKIKALNGEDYCIVAAIINGYTDTGYEWVSNFNLGTSIYHDGFGMASALVYDKLQSYISQNTKGVKKKNIKIWITGHSRGAAIANILGIELANPIVYYENAGRFSQDNVYVYGFATPNYLRDRQGDSSYKYIHNYCILGDMVPELAPQRDGWNYTKKGSNIFFDTESEKASTMKTMFHNFVGRTFDGLTKKKRDNIIDAFCNFGVNRDKFYTKEYEYIILGPLLTPALSDYNMALLVEKGVKEGFLVEKMTPAFYAQQGIGLFMSDTLYGKISGGINLLKKWGFLDKAGRILYDVLVENVDGIADSHMMGTYLAWIMTSYGGISVEATI